MKYYKESQLPRLIGPRGVGEKEHPLKQTLLAIGKHKINKIGGS